MKVGSVGPRDINLDEEATAVGLSVEQQIALGEHRLRKDIAKWILCVFIAANVVVLAGLAASFGFDVTLLRGGTIAPADRIVTSEVLMTVIGGTTVQLGAVMYLIANYLFPSATNR
jgi:phage shock protein PspC (stress-responsive transcriptional regulator)